MFTVLSLPLVAPLRVAPRTSRAAIRPSSRLARPVPRRSRCSGGFIRGLLTLIHSITSRHRIVSSASPGNLSYPVTQWNIEPTNMRSRSSGPISQLDGGDMAATTGQVPQTGVELVLMDGRHPPLPFLLGKKDGARSHEFLGTARRTARRPCACLPKRYPAARHPRATARSGSAAAVRPPYTKRRPTTPSSSRVCCATSREAKRWPSPRSGRIAA